MFNFDISDPIVALRILCGVFLIPHAWSKLFTRAGPIGFFTAAGIKPAEPVVLAALVLELLAATGLILGIYPRYAALLTAAFLLFAMVAVVRVSKGRWLWNLGGAEYCVFWALCCLLVAAHT